MQVKHGPFLRIFMSMVQESVAMGSVLTWGHFLMSQVMAGHEVDSVGIA